MLSRLQVKALILAARIATHTSLNITDQFLYARINDRHPLLVSMGTNDISSDCPRLNEFVMQYHEQYGRLNVMVRLRPREKDSPSRRDSLNAFVPPPIHPLASTRLMTLLPTTTARGSTLVLLYGKRYLTDITKRAS